MVITTGSLFSGVGLLDLAIELTLKSELQFQVEVDPWRQRVLSKHFPQVYKHLDISNFVGNPVDLLFGGFPCFVAGTLVETDHGLVPIENLVVGDRVLTHNQQWRRVTATMNKPNAPIWGVSAFGAPEILTTAEHPFYASIKRILPRKNGQPRKYVLEPPSWVEAKDLTSSHFVAQPCNLPTAVVPEWVTPENAYIIGRWLGDGWIVDYQRNAERPNKHKPNGSSRANSRCKKMLICCAAKEENELAKRIKDAGLHATVARERTVVKFHISSATWVDRLKDFGRGAAGKKLAGWVLGAPKAIVEQMLTGYLDADGCQGALGTRATTISPQLALGVAAMMRLVYKQAPGFYYCERPPTCVIEGRVVNQKSTYSVHLHGSNRRAVYKDGFMWVPVKKSQATDKQADVFNISVEEDESYVAGSVVVHNCQDVSGMGNKKGLHGERSGLWYHFNRIIRATRPGCVFIENVSGVAQRGLDEVLEDLNRNDYHTRYGLLGAHDVGLPHRRQRYWILAYSSEERLQALREAHYTNWPDAWREHLTRRGMGMDTPLGTGFSTHPGWYSHQPYVRRATDASTIRLDRCRLGGIGDSVCVPSAIMALTGLLFSGV